MPIVHLSISDANSYFACTLWLHFQCSTLSTVLMLSLRKKNSRNFFFQKKCRENFLFASIEGFSHILTYWYVFTHSSHCHPWSSYEWIVSKLFEINWISITLIIFVYDIRRPTSIILLYDISAIASVISVTKITEWWWFESGGSLWRLPVSLFWR
jgi:hypothetical protein